MDCIFVSFDLGGKLVVFNISEGITDIYSYFKVVVDSTVLGFCDGRHYILHRFHLVKMVPLAGGAGVVVLGGEEESLSLGSSGQKYGYEYQE